MADDEIARYAGSGAGIANLRSLADTAWADVLQDPAEASKLAELLHVTDGTSLKAGESPFAFKIDKSGITGIEFVVGVFVAPYAKAFFVGISAAAGKETATQVWKRFILPRIRQKNPDALGTEKKPGPNGAPGP